MAKIKAKTRDPKATTTRPYSEHRMSVEVTVQRIAATPGRAFEACARIKSRREGGRNAAGWTCRFDKNPRKATEGALKAVAKDVGTRSGAFAGLGKK